MSRVWWDLADRLTVQGMGGPADQLMCTVWSDPTDQLTVNGMGDLLIRLMCRVWWTLIIN